MVGVRARKFKKYLREKYFKKYLRKTLVAFCEYKKLRKLTFPTVPFVFDYGINWDGITVGKESEGLLGRGWIQFEIFEVSAEYQKGIGSRNLEN